MERTRMIRLGTVLAAVVLGVAACGSGSGSTTSSPGGTTSAAAAAAHLTTADGLTVYLFAPDTKGVSTCYGACAHAWPPVPAGTRLASTTGSVAAAMLGTTTRRDGSRQLTYAGHPLYRYIHDMSAGQTTGQGLDAGGGLWWLVSPKGAAITSGGSTPSPAGSSSGGSGGGYGY